MIGDRKQSNYSTSSGPIVSMGRWCKAWVDAQVSGGKMLHQRLRCQTGKEAWRFYTIAKEGELGGDTWGKLPNLFRAGGETWITGSYDPDLNLTYWGVAQSKPWMRSSRQSGNGATLFANSTVALNADTGKLAWYFSHAPGESLDLDEVFERVLVDDGGQKLVFSAGKAGILGRTTARPANISVTRRRYFRTSTSRSIPKAASRTIATISSRISSVPGCKAARRRKAATTGTP